MKEEGQPLRRLMKDETQGNLDNMPYHLQDTSSAGELMTERIEQLDEMITEFDDIDWEIELDRADYESDEEYEGAVDDKRQEIVDVIQAISYNGG